MWCVSVLMETMLRWLLVSVALLACTTEQRDRGNAPVLEVTHGGGFFGHNKGSTVVWVDGTVTFEGPKCHEATGRRASVSPERITSLIGELVLTGVLDHAPSVPSRSTGKEPGCGFARDAFYASLTIRTNERTVTMRRDFGCPWFDKARATIDAAVGTNPCR